MGRPRIEGLRRLYITTTDKTIERMNALLVHENYEGESYSSLLRILVKAEYEAMKKRN